MAEGTGRMALVTGASAGIGAAFARVLAEHGYDLILTARRLERLEQLAAALREQHGIRTLVVADNLADPQAPQRLMGEISAAGWRVDLLVNNAGYGVPGSYAATAWDAQRDFLQVLVSAVAHLSHLALPGMIERQWGRIINVASLAGLMPGVAGHTLYAASKAFVVSFSESLALEAARHHVHVTASCPGFTLSEFHDVTGTRHRVSQMPSFLWMDADSVARDSYAAVMAGRPVYTPGRVNRTLALAARLLPRGVVRAAMSRSAGRFRET
jgi:short-subunit dehydrogenase